MIGLAFKNLGKNQAAASVLYQEPNPKDFIIFTQDKEPPCLPVNTSNIDLYRAFVFNGPIIAFDLSTIFNLQYAFNTKLYFYVDNTNINNKTHDNIIGNKNITKIWRSDFHKGNRPGLVIENFDLKQIQEAINGTNV